MDLAASSSSAPTSENPAIEKARDKQRRKIVESVSGLKADDQIEFLISRLAEAEMGNTEQKKETEKLRRESNKIVAKLSSAEKLLSKTEVAKSKLEQLCRELNKAQREEKEQNAQRIKQMQTIHGDTVESFKKSLADIQLSVEAKQEHSKRVADVEKISNSLNQMTTDYETRLNELKILYEEREKDLGALSKAKDQELQGLHVQIEEMQKRIHEVFAENVALKKELLASEERVKKSIESEISLRKLLDDYSKKYASLTKSLDQSNTAFEKVKVQLGKMNGKMIKVETDARKWKARAEEAKELLETARKERADTEQLVALKDRQLVQLQELCRRLKNGGQEPVKADTDCGLNGAGGAEKANPEGEEETQKLDETRETAKEKEEDGVAASNGGE